MGALPRPCFAGRTAKVTEKGKFHLGGKEHRAA
jgi:hypothetical protein